MFKTKLVQNVPNCLPNNWAKKVLNIKTVFIDQKEQPAELLNISQGSCCRYFPGTLQLSLGLNIPGDVSPLTESDTWVVSMVPPNGKRLEGQKNIEVGHLSVWTLQYLEGWAICQVIRARWLQQLKLPATRHVVYSGVQLRRNAFTSSVTYSHTGAFVAWWVITP